MAFSIETRKEQGEGYSTLKGFFKQYELYYVVGDERDLIRVRTDFREPREDVYLYRLRMSPNNARKFFMADIRQINSLRKSPEWYNTQATNCTTNLVRHVRTFEGRVKYNWKVLLSGYAPSMPMGLERSTHTSLSMSFAKGVTSIRRPSPSATIRILRARYARDCEDQGDKSSTKVLI